MPLQQERERKPIAKSVEGQVLPWRLMRIRLKRHRADYSSLRWNLHGNQNSNFGYRLPLLLATDVGAVGGGGGGVPLGVVVDSCSLSRYSVRRSSGNVFDRCQMSTSFFILSYKVTLSCCPRKKKGDNGGVRNTKEIEDTIEKIE